MQNKTAHNSHHFFVNKKKDRCSKNCFLDCYFRKHMNLICDEDVVIK